MQDARDAVHALNQNITAAIATGDAAIEIEGDLLLCIEIDTDQVSSSIAVNFSMAAPVLRYLK